MLEVRQFSISEPQLAGIKIVFVGDFHLKPNQSERLDKIINLTNEQKPDIVLSIGDFVSGHNPKMTMPIDKIAAKLGQIKPKYGFYTVLGNMIGGLTAKWLQTSFKKMA